MFQLWNDFEGNRLFVPLIAFVTGSETFDI